MSQTILDLNSNIAISNKIYDLYICAGNYKAAMFRAGLSLLRSNQAVLSRQCPLLSAAGTCGLHDLQQVARTECVSLVPYREASNESKVSWIYSTYFMARNNIDKFYLKSLCVFQTC